MSKLAPRLGLPLALAAMALAPLAAVRPAMGEALSIDKAHSEVGFSIRHLVSKTRGRFDDFEGTVNFDRAKPEASSVDLHISATSIDTANESRDKHLRSADFFDVEKNPDITFRSSAVKKTGADTYDVTGTLTMKGVAKEITLPVTVLGTAKDPWGNERAGFETAVRLNRKDYGIVWNKALDTGGLMLGEDVDVSIALETVAKKAEDGAKPASAAKPGDAAKPGTAAKAGDGIKPTAGKTTGDAKPAAGTTAKPDGK